MKRFNLAVIGAGNRGTALARQALGSRWTVEIGALADPNPDALKRAGDLFELPTGNRYEGDRELLDRADEFDAAFVATDVRSHARIACECLEAGLPVYLEKPMTRTIDEALRVRATARSTGVPIMVGMNMRFGPFYRRLKDLVSGGAVGEPISIEWKEVLSPVAWADGYCRAGWYSRTRDVGGWLLEKSCHDIDMINWLVDTPCERVASLGSRSLFLPRDDVPRRCTDGCPIESKCYFSCLRLHPDGPDSCALYVPRDRWDLCVYHSGSDLVDRQVAILEYAGGVTAAFSLLPVGNRWERLMRICGSEATIRGSDSAKEIHIYPHDCKEPVVEELAAVEGGHGGADPGVVAAFLGYIENPDVPPPVTLEEGVESILCAAGIEMAREERRLVELGPLREAGGLSASSAVAEA